MKKIIIYFILFLTTFQVKAQDTLIEGSNFILDIYKTTANLKSFHYEKTNEKGEIIAFELQDDISSIVNKWLNFMQLEAIDYKIVGDLYGTRPEQAIDSTSMYFYSYSVTLFDQLGSDAIEAQKEAFTTFANFIGIELDTIFEKKSYWELRIVDDKNSAFSVPNNSTWKRTEYEEYIYYENIEFRRVAELLTRNLYNFVRPLPYNANRLNIKMPYSDDFFDLKYAMIEQGLELTEIIKEVEVLVIKME